MEPLTKGDEKQSLEKDIKAEPTGFAINVGFMDTWHLKSRCDHRHEKSNCLELRGILDI